MTVEQVPTIGISFSGELPGKRSLVLQSHIERDVEPKELNAVLDKVRASFDRQFAFGALVQLRLQLEQEEKMASDHAKRMAQVDQNIKDNWGKGNRRGDVQFSQKERQEQEQAYAHAEECKLRIGKVKQQIAEFEAQIGA